MVCAKVMAESMVRIMESALPLVRRVRRWPSATSPNEMWQPNLWWVEAREPRIVMYCRNVLGAQERKMACWMFCGGPGWRFAIRRIVEWMSSNVFREGEWDWTVGVRVGGVHPPGGEEEESAVVVEEGAWGYQWSY